MKLWAGEERPLITAIVPIYNQLSFCQRAVESLLLYKGINDEDIQIVLFDQGSPYEGVSEWLGEMEDDERVEVWGGGTNIGVGACLNAVIQGTDSSFVFKYDDDNSLMPFTLPLMVIAHTMANSSGFPLGILSADVLGVGKSEGPFEEVELMPGVTLECTPIVGGGAILINRKLIEEIGPFRADRIYGVEDGDYALRVMQKGYRNGYLKGAYHVSYCRGEEADPCIDAWKLEFYHHKTDMDFATWRKGKE